MVSEEFSTKFGKAAKSIQISHEQPFPCPTPLSLLPRSSLRRLDNISTKPARDLGLGDDTLQKQCIAKPSFKIHEIVL